LYGVLRYSTLSIISGVFSKVPGRVPNSGSASSFGFHSQAIWRRPTFARSMSVSGE
jgi:hypothetical protein